VEVLCEGACVLNDRDEMPIKIALLQRHATDYVLEKRLKLFDAGPPTGKKVAIVGAGPAGLACARDLRRFGHAVTVFEAKAQPGGLNTYGIAEYKLKADVALAEVQDILDLGVELRAGVVVGQDIPLDRLLAEYDAVFVGVGLGATKALGIPGEDLPGVIDALSFIEHLKTHPYRETAVGRHVVVIGAGNTAIDAATQAKRLGAAEATIVYRRGERDMSCYHYEYELAKRDGCGFRFHAVPQRIVANGHGGIAGLEVRTPQGTETLACDMVIVAIGQGAPALSWPAEHPTLFVGGDCANGGAEIVNAAAEGVSAAKRIHERLTHG
jgi:glutamate synthase (NADPH/NADH) small chain